MKIVSGPLRSPQEIVAAMQVCTSKSVLKNKMSSAKKRANIGFNENLSELCL